MREPQLAAGIGSAEAWARKQLDLFGCPRHTIRIVTHDGQPIPKARARVVRGGGYTPRSTRIAQDALAFSMLALGRLEGNVALACMFYRADQRVVDGDNLEKLVWDAGTDARVWRDDSQITAHAGRLELDREHPRTVIALAPHESTLRRHVTRVK